MSNGSDGEAPPKIKPREYQVEVVERALKENTVACLPTGSGKTYIAIMVMKEMADQLHNSFEDGGKRTFFLVPSVALVTQQLKVIKEYTPLKVKGYIGSDGVDGWDKDKWFCEFSEYQVLVMTVQIMVNILAHGYLRNRLYEGLGCANLLILDECHHTAKNDPYVQVMSRLDDCNPADCPRILGLSASLVNQSSKSIETFESDISKLVSKLKARLTTARDLAEVQKYATKPDIRIVHYNSIEQPNDVTAVLTQLAQFLTEHPYYKVLFRPLKNGIITLTLIYSEMGPFAARKAARTMAKDISRVTARDPTGIFRLCMSRLRLVAAITKRESYDPNTQELVLRPKLRKLKEVMLSHVRHMSSIDKRLMGIVFVDRRYFALALDAVFKQMGKVDRNFGEAVQSNFLTGHGDLDIMSREASMKYKTQNKIISEFSKQAINVLVATKVAEEGLDIRKCNLVVRFDPLTEFRGYVQSRGRARDKPSLFIVMAPIDKQREVETRLKKFDDYEKHLIKCCREEHKDFYLLWENDDDNLSRAAPEDEELMFEELHKICPPFYPNKEHRALARADLANSVELIHSYVSKLCKDGTKLAPKFTIMETYSEHFPTAQACYECTVVLPLCSALPNMRVEGMAMPSHRLAKRAACLEVVKRLHAIGEMNDNLHAFPLENIFEEDEFDERDIQRLPDISAPGRKKIVLNDQVSYSVRVPECLKSPARSASRFFLYSLSVTSTHPDLAGRCMPIFGLLVAKPLAESEPFQLTHRLGSLDVNVSLVSDAIRLTPEQAVVVSRFSEFLFTKIINVPSSKCEFANRLHFVELQPSQLTNNEAHWYAAVVLVTKPVSAGDVVTLDLPAMIDLQGRTDNFTSPWSQAAANGIIRAAPGCVVERDFERAERDSRGRGRCEVLEIRAGTSSRTPTKDNQSVTYAEQARYFGYGELSFPELPLIKVVRANLHWDYITSKVVGAEGKAGSKCAVMYYLPEITKLHVFSAKQLHTASVLPSLLTRLFHYQQAAECHVALCSSMALQAREQLPDTPFAVSARDADGLSSGNTPENAVCFGSMAANSHTHGLATTFPSVSLIFKSLSRVGCQYEVNLERLEMLGDSFLKIATSVYLFCHPKLHARMASEGRLTSHRMQMIANATLFKASRQRDLAPFLFKLFRQIKNDFFPPLCWFSSEPTYSSDVSSADEPDAKRLRSGSDAQSSVEPDAMRLDRADPTKNVLKVKQVADSIEAMIGSFLLAGGNDAARHFMVWCGLPYVSLTAKVEQSVVKETGGNGGGDSARSAEREDSTATLVVSGHASSVTPSKPTASHGRATPGHDTSSPVQISPTSRRRQRSEVMPGFSPIGDLLSPIYAHDSSPVALGAKRFVPDATAAETKVKPPAPLSKYKYTNEQFLEPKLPKSPREKFLKQSGQMRLPPYGRDLAILQKNLGYEFNDPSWLLEAITHASYDQSDDGLFVRSYQQLEFLGDAILDYLVVRYVYEKSESLGPGDLAAILHYVTSNQKLAEIAISRKYNLHRFLRYSNSELFGNIRRFVEDYRERTGDTGDNEFADVSSENFISAESDGVEEPGLEWPNIDQDSDADDNDDTVDGSADNPVEANNTDESEDVIEKPSVIAPKALGDVMESVVAAVFADVDMDLDRTWEVVWPIMKETIEYALERARSGELKSPIAQLLEQVTEASFNVEATGRLQRGTYVVHIAGQEKQVFTAVAEGKRAAKIAAARKGVAYLSKLGKSNMVH